MRHYFSGRIDPLFAFILAWVLPFVLFLLLPQLTHPLMGSVVEFQLKRVFDTDTMSQETKIAIATEVVQRVQAGYLICLLACKFALQTFFTWPYWRSIRCGRTPGLTSWLGLVLLVAYILYLGGTGTLGAMSLVQSLG